MAVPRVRRRLPRERDITSEFTLADKVKLISTEFGATVGALNSLGALVIPDGIPEPPAVVSFTQIYVDQADGNLKVKFGDGTVKTLATNP